MHSYSFDISINKPKNSTKTVIKLSDLSWATLTLLVITIIQLVFSLHFYLLSLLVGLAIIAFSIDLLRRLRKKEEELIFDQILIRKFWLIYLGGACLLDIFIAFVFNRSFMWGFQSKSNYELYFSLLNLFLLIYRPLHLGVMFFYVRAYLSLVDSKDGANTEFMN